MIIRGDARHLPLADGSVQMSVTSPPYWGLRSYAGLPDSIWDGDESCGHEWVGEVPREGFLGKPRWQHTTNGRGEEQPDEKRLRTSTTRETRPEAWGEVQQGAFCRCGAWRGQYGLEPTLEMYVAHTVEVFREVRRVLKDDGTLWLNLGDSFARDPGKGEKFRGKSATYLHHNHDALRGPEVASGLKAKDLCGIPWRVAFALQADGWWLRSDIVWAKPNPMPESVTDRPTRSHEHIFLLAKSERYFYDADAIREDLSPSTVERWEGAAPRYAGAEDYFHRRDNGAHLKQLGQTGLPPKGNRNKRDVWTVNTEPTPEAHFATFPQKLIEPCILAGSRVGDVVLDPFLGSGTVGKVCERLGRRWVGVELSGDYIEIAKRRTQQMGLFAGMGR